ncbi:MAG TPA: group III truncated hemoglobin [Oleiagrimonas sp.]|nr:group III truncated hemoglobin [Oleiagrimonas sp.]
MTQVKHASWRLDYPSHMTVSLQTPTAPTLDEAHIARLVNRFYDKVQADDLIGPVFNAIVDDWDEHKRLLTRFWCSVALRASGYRGNPMAKHRPLPIGREHFERWLTLWGETVPEIMEADAAAIMIDYAQRIGRGLRMGMGLGDRPRGRDLGIPMYEASRGKSRIDE